MQCQQALHIRYEDMLTKYDDEVERLLDFLRLDKENTKIQTEISKYRPENAQSDQKGIHFSQGKIGRFRNKMTVEQQNAMNDAFESYLTKMEY
jgi:ABC-type transporter MlaC component